MEMSGRFLLSGSLGLTESQDWGGGEGGENGREGGREDRGRENRGREREGGRGRGGWNEREEDGMKQQIQLESPTHTSRVLTGRYISGCRKAD